MREEARRAEALEAENNKPLLQQQTVGGASNTDWSQKAVVDEDEL
jgi:hypothetical protein